MKNFTYSLLLLLLAGTVLSSCSKDDDEGPRKEPVYTTVSLKFTNKANASDTKTITYKDMDGNGEMVPQTINTLKLKPFAEYNAEIISIMDETQSPPTDLLSTVERDNANYIVIYDVYLANLGFTTINYDKNNEDLGTRTTVHTGAKCTGNVTVKLFKNPQSKKTADIQGDIQFAYTFPVEIE